MLPSAFCLKDEGRCFPVSVERLGAGLVLDRPVSENKSVYLDLWAKEEKPRETAGTELGGCCRTQYFTCLGRAFVNISCGMGILNVTKTQLRDLLQGPWKIQGDSRGFSLNK